MILKKSIFRRGSYIATNEGENGAKLEAPEEGIKRGGNKRKSKRMKRVPQGVAQDQGKGVLKAPSICTEGVYQQRTLLICQSFRVNKWFCLKNVFLTQMINEPK